MRRNSPFSFSPMEDNEKELSRGDIAYFAKIFDLLAQADFEDYT